MHKRERQGGFFLPVVLALSVFFAVFLLFILSSGERARETFAERRQLDDLSVLAPAIYETLLTNPPLWQYTVAANFIGVIRAVGFVWPNDLNVHIGAVQISNNIRFRHYVVCRRCPDISPFNNNGDFNTQNITVAGVSVYHLFNGYHLQLDGISRAQKDLSRIADKFVDAYQNFSRLQQEGVITCLTVKLNGECNYFRGCDFDRDGLMPCTEGETGRKLAAGKFDILGGDFYSVWGDISVYNGGAGETDKREQPMALVTTGPLTIQVQLIVPPPI